MSKKTATRTLSFMSLDEIKKRIEKAKKTGRKARWFFLTQMTKENYDHLKNEGYKIHSGFPIEKTSFKISW